MKRIFIAVLFSVLAGVSGWAAQQTLTGQISDGMCGASHAAMGDMGRNPKTCTAGCVKGGAKYVFVSKGKVYAIQNQDFGSLAANAGSDVEVAGTLDKDGKAITLTKIARAGR